MTTSDSRRRHPRVDHVDIQRNYPKRLISVHSTKYKAWSARVRTVYGIRADDLADALDDPAPADLLDVLGVRDDEADLSVVHEIVPAHEPVPDPDVLSTQGELALVAIGAGGRGLQGKREGRTHDVGLVRREQALLRGVPEVTAVVNRDFLQTDRIVSS